MDGPPSYDGLYSGSAASAPDIQRDRYSINERRTPMEEFTIDDSQILEEDPLYSYNSNARTRRQRLRDAFRAYRADPLNSAGRAISGLFNSVESLASSVQNGIERAVSPITRPCKYVITRLDQAVDGIINPLLVHRLLFLMAVFAGLYAFYSTWDEAPSSVLVGGGVSSGSRFLEPSFLYEYLREHIDPTHMEHTAHYLDTIPHAVGSRGAVSIARHVDSSFKSFGLRSVTTHSTPAYLTRNNRTSLTLFSGEAAVLTTNLLEGDANLGRDGFVRQAPSHMSLSQGGRVKGHLLYANFGSESDLELLRDRNIDLSGAIVMVKFGEDDRPGTVAKRLESAGAKGAIFFSRKSPGFDTWPQGPDYSEEAVQRGCVALPELYPGDLLSPGWPSTSAMAITNFDSSVRNVAKIPVVSSSWKDIAPFLQSLDGHGVAVDDWHNNGYPRGVDHWFTGSSDDSGVTVELDVQVDVERRGTTHSVVGKMASRDDQAHVVILGARLDSYCAGGSSMSGLTMLLEIARTLSSLAYKHNWLPLRPIYFAAWDGTGANFAGATEWAEIWEEQLRRDGIAYIDLDEVVGDQLRIEGTPSIMLDEALKSVSFNASHLLSDLARQPSTEIRFDDGMISSLPHWAHFENAEVFSSHVLTPALRLRLDSNLPVPRDSCFDSTSWTSRFGDSDYSGHRAIAELAARLAVQYADQPLVQYSLTRHSTQLRQDFAATKAYLQQKFDASKMSRLDLQSVGDLIESWSRAAVRLDAKVSKWQQQFYGEFEGMPATAREPQGSKLMRDAINDRLVMLPKGVYSPSGIPGRPWYHTKLMGITGSGKAATYGCPSLRDAADHGSMEEAHNAVQRLYNALDALTRRAEVLLTTS